MGGGWAGAGPAPSGASSVALARVGVGVGEAAGSPPAHSLISDYFPPEKRATAMGIYSWGIYVGSALAFLGGSAGRRSHCAATGAMASRAQYYHS